MTYKPDPIDNVKAADFPNYVHREMLKIAAFLATLAPRPEPEPVPTPVPAPSPSSDVLWSCGFLTSPEDSDFHEQAKVPGRAQVVPSGRAPGYNSVRLHTEPGDNNVAGSGQSERNDLSLPQSMTDGFEGREHWWAHSVMFPDDYVDPPPSQLGGTWNFGLVFDFHNTKSGPGRANMQVMAMPKTAESPDRPTGLSIELASGDQLNPTIKRYPIGPIERGKWYDFVYHVRWTSKGDGFFKASVNYNPVVDYQGPTLYEGQGVYLKLANYHTAHGKPSSVLHSRIIRGKTRESVTL